MKKSISKFLSLVLCVLIVFAVPFSAVAAEGDTAFTTTQATFTGTNGITLSYEITLPADYDAANKYPVLFYLHHYGGDVDTQAYQTLLQYVYEHFGFKAIVVAPTAVAENGEYWIDSTVLEAAFAGGLTDDTLLRDITITPALLAAKELLTEIRARNDVDAANILGMGTSMGAFGIWNLLTEYPGIFTAAAPICGGGNTALAATVVNTPIHIFHGSADNIVSVELSRNMVAAIEALGGNKIEYTEYTEAPENGHTEHLYLSLNSAIPWLFDNMAASSEPFDWSTAVSEYYTPFSFEDDAGNVFADNRFFNVDEKVNISESYDALDEQRLFIQKTDNTGSGYLVYSFADEYITSFSADMLLVNGFVHTDVVSNYLKVEALVEGAAEYVDVPLVQSEFTQITDNGAYSAYTNTVNNAAALPERTVKLKITLDPVPYNYINYTVRMDALSLGLVKKGLFVDTLDFLDKVSASENMIAGWNYGKDDVAFNGAQKEAHEGSGYIEYSFENKGIKNFCIDFNYLTGNLYEDISFNIAVSYKLPGSDEYINADVVRSEDEVLNASYSASRLTLANELPAAAEKLRITVDPTALNIINYVLYIDNVMLVLENATTATIDCSDSAVSSALISADAFPAGSEVELNVIVPEGRIAILGSVYYINSAGEVVIADKKSSGKFTFKMPEEDVTVIAKTVPYNASSLISTAAVTIKDNAKDATYYSAKFDQSALQFDSIAAKEYNSVPLYACGTVIFKSELLNTMSVQEIFDQNLGKRVPKSVTRYEDASGVQYAVRLYGIEENNKQNEYYSAFSYASYGNELGVVTLLSEPVEGTYTDTYTDKAASYNGFINSESDWLASLQLSNGAITTAGLANGMGSINPYFANISANALLEINGAAYAPQVKNWMDWYLAHVNTAETDPNAVPGTVCDYEVTVDESGNIVETSKNDYDSTDSYAATFLKLLNSYCETVGSFSYAEANYVKVADIYNAMLITFNPDYNLTYAKPGYAAYYLMDNTEVYEGLKAAVNIFDKILPAFKEGAEEKLNNILTGIEGLYVADGGYYKWEALNEFTWSRWYADALAQLYPIATGIIDPGSERALDIYNSFNSYYAEGGTMNYAWEKLHNPDEDEFIHGIAVYAASIMGDTDKVDSFISAYSSRYMADHQYPLTSADAAWSIFAAKTIGGKYIAIAEHTIAYK